MIRMNYYKATIQYDGTNYFGFQWQKDIPTIQNDFNLSLKQLISGKISTVGASRTDSGVHAIEQIVKITSEQQIECGSFLTKLNNSLPAQIKCLSIVPCEGSFNPITGSASKEYRYLFTNKLQSSCFDQRFIANNPYSLDLGLMKKCAKEIVGKHDFHNFCSAGSNVKTTIRDVSLCEFTEVDPHAVLPQSDLFLLPHDLRHCYQLRIEGSGFLKQMVRHLMSALWLIGGNKLTPVEFSLLINGPAKTRRLWKVASPRGLHLYQFKSSAVV
ncbi:MAG TPA: tRNA pseudouridine(38-40) synthase TruA [Bacteriovoracaceae bacterium]|nr:tRNA pseudouridine(38-40) synthase TruA [Bacteriovoracaceae bacterium]